MVCIVKTLPTLSIAIPAYNEESVIERCIVACATQVPLADEIIVIDNNSRDETLSIAQDVARRYPQANIRVVSEKKQGLLPARDRGFQEATSEIVGRIDADSILEPGWVQAVKEVFVDPEVMAASGPVVYYDMPLRKLGLKVDNIIRKLLHQNAKDHRFLFGTNMAVRATAWDAIKEHIPPDPNDEYHEDVSIAITLFQHGLEIAYAPLMVAGMSARRIEDKPKDFYRYIMRYERTFKAHGVKSAQARMPIFIYLLIYFPVRTIRQFYDTDTNKFTWRKLTEQIKSHTKSD